MSESQKPLTIVYMGSPAFAVPSFLALLQAGHEIPLVVSQPDKPKGRKGVLTPTAVKTAALEHDVPVITPKNINEEEVVAQIAACQPDLLVVAAFGQILKRPLLQLAPKGAVNIHASLLPQYRGAAPIHYAVLNGDTVTGVTTMYMAAGLDTGDMILQQKVEIGPADNTGSLTAKLAVAGADLILDTVELIAQDLAPRQPQKEEKACYAHKILRQQEQIDWQQPAGAICNLVRALAPEIGAYTNFEEKGKPQVVKVWTAALARDDSLFAKELLEKSTAAKSGTLLGADKQGVFVACGGSVLKLLAIQPAGKGQMLAVDWWRGKQNQAAQGPLRFVSIQK